MVQMARHLGGPGHGRGDAMAAGLFHVFFQFQGCSALLAMGIPLAARICCDASTTFFRTPASPWRKQACFQKESPFMQAGSVDDPGVGQVLWHLYGHAVSGHGRQATGRLPAGCRTGQLRSQHFPAVIGAAAVSHCGLRPLPAMQAKPTSETGRGRMPRAARSLLLRRSRAHGGPDEAGYVKNQGDAAVAVDGCAGNEVQSFVDVA